MKTTLILTGIISLLTASAAQAEDWTKPVEKPKARDLVLSPVSAYVPSGFDSGSAAFIVVNGMFPNSCYKIKESKVDHVGPALHEVRTIATVTEGLCLTVMIPYSKEIQLGKLNAGSHEIRVMGGDGTYFAKSLVIEN